MLRANRIVLGLVALVLMTGSWVMLERGRQVDRRLREQLLTQAVDLARTINPEQVKSLSFSSADKTNASFVRLRSQMILYGQAMGLKSIYSQALRQGHIVFGPENLDEHHPAASPPGTVYEQPSAENLRIFGNCQAFTQGPTRDEYGTFVSAYAPVKDPRSGQVELVVGLDQEARDWNQAIWRSRLLPMFFTGLLVGLLLTGRLLLWWRARPGPSPRWLRHTEVLLTGACGLALTWAMTLWAHERESRARQDAFAQVVESQAAMVREANQALRDYLLVGLSQFLAHDPQLSREEFHNYVQPLVKRVAFKSFNWVPKVAAAQCEQLEAQVRQSGLSNFSIFQRDWRGQQVPVSGRTNYYPVVYIEPMEGNESALGFELGSDPVRRAAMEESLQMGLPTATEPLVLIGAAHQERSVLVYYPVLEPGQSASSSPAGGPEVRGFALAVVECEAFLEQVLAGTGSQSEALELDQYLLSPLRQPLWLACWPRAVQGQSRARPLAGGERLEELLAVRPLFAFGKTYALAFRPGAAFLASHPASDKWIAALMGLVLTLGASASVGAMRRRQRWLEREVLSRTETLRASEESYRRQFADNRAIMLLVNAADGHLVDANAAACRFYGYEREQLQSMGVSDLNSLPEAQVRSAMGSVSEPQGSSFEFEHRLADGSLRQVEVHASAIRFGDTRLLHSIIHDITERKRAEQALERSRRQLSTAMAMAQLAHWEFDVASGLFTFDEQFYGLYATDSRQEGGFQMAAQEYAKRFLFAEDYHLVAEGVAQALQATEADFTLHLEHPMRRRDGQVRQLLVRLGVIQDGAGRVVKLHGANQDITDLRQIEAALKARQDKLDSILRTAPVAIGLAVNRRLTEVNSSLCHLSGYSAQELMGQSTRLLYPTQEDFERVGREGYEQLQAKAAFSIETRWLARGGQVFEILLTASLTVPGNPSAGITFVGLDITERKAAEARLRSSAERLRTLWQALEHSPASVVLTDLQGRIEYVNPKFSEVSGYSAQEVVGQNPRVLKGGKMPVKVYQEMWQTISAGQTWRGELCNRKKDGSLFWESALISPVKEEGGTLTHYLAIKEDITERKRAEQELQHLNMQWELASARASEMAVKAELANIAKSQFLANMSHEIRTPLNGVMGMTRLLLDTSLNAEQRQYAAVAQSSSQALLSVINDILDFSKIEAGKLELEHLEFDLRATLEDTADLLAVKAAEKHLELACRIAPEVPLSLKGDAGRLRQVLLNLGGNAVKFTSQGGVLLLAELEKQEPTHVTVRFTVSDTGVGIPVERLPALFSPFTQVDASTTRRFGGTGLGLAICKQLAHLMQGQTGVQSQEGKGSSFWVSARFEKQPGSAPAWVAPAQLQGLRLLVVEEHQPSRQALVSLLQTLGCQATEAAHGPAALELLAQGLCQQAAFHLALVSHTLAEPSQLSRAQPGLALVKLARLGHNDGAEQLARQGFAAQLSKPVRLAQLQECLLGLATAQGSMPAPLAREGRPAALEAAAARATLRILLVDDHQTNQLVGLKMLERLGYGAQAVSSGQEALSALPGARFDLVLMDCQMPEMDGFETTRRIRQGQAGPANEQLPIIALTANAMRSDRQNCLAAGMDDHIAKPIDIEELAGLLARWQSKLAPMAEAQPAQPARPQAPTPGPGAARAAGPACEPAAKSVLNLAPLLKRALNNSALAGRIAAGVWAQLPGQVSHLRLCLQRGEWSEAATLAHQLGGAAQTLGAESLQQLAGELEQASRQQEPARVDQLLGQLEPQIESLAQALAPLLAPAEAPEAKPVPAPVQLSQNPRQGARLEAQAPEPSAAARGSAPPGSSGLQLHNRQAFLQRLGQDMALAKTITASFLAELPQQAGRLKQAIEGRDCSQVAQLAHRLRGAAGTMGAETLHQLSRQLEEAAKAGTQAQLAALLPGLEVEVAALTESLKAFP